MKHTDAEKYKVNDMLTEGKTYTVVNETEEYILSRTTPVKPVTGSYFEDVND